MPKKPSSAISRIASAGYSCSRSQRSDPGARRSWAKRRAISWTLCCSSVNNMLVSCLFSKRPGAGSAPAGGFGYAWTACHAGAARLREYTARRRPGMAGAMRPGVDFLRASPRDGGLGALPEMSADAAMRAPETVVATAAAPHPFVAVVLRQVGVNWKRRTSCGRNRGKADTRPAAPSWARRRRGSGSAGRSSHPNPARPSARAPRTT